MSPSQLAHVLEHVTCTVLFVDIVESVRLIDADENGVIARWLNLLEHIETHILPSCDGRLVKRLGDGMLLEFSHVQGAIAAAFAIQETGSQGNVGLSPDKQILLRMGMEVSDVIVDRNDVYGRGVNRAARLATLASPGEIVISADVREQLTPALDADVEDLGACFLKHVREPVRAYRMGPPGPHLMMEPGISLSELLPSIAIVPFTARDVAPEHDVLGEVLAEEIIRELSRSTEVSVISRLSTTPFRRRHVTSIEVGAHLDTDYVLSGAYQIKNRQIALDATFAEAKSGRIVWAKRHRARISEAWGSKREMVDQLVRDVSTAVLSREIQRAQSQALPTLPSYTLLIGAIALMHRLSARDFDEARKLLEALIERATRQAIPRAWLARWHVLRVQQGWSSDPKQEAQLALQCTRQALDTDPHCSLALAVDGFVHTNLLKQLDTARQRYEAAIAANPNEALAWLLKGTLHAFMDEGLQGVVCARRALRLSPLDPHRYFYDSLAATTYLAAHQPERALKHAQRSLRANRTHTSTLRALTVAQWQLGLGDEARRTARELLTLEPTLTVSRWQERSPSAAYAIGKEWAEVFRQVGVPE
jgi:adenylate cyclase